MPSGIVLRLEGSAWARDPARPGFFSHSESARAGKQSEGNVSYRPALHRHRWKVGSAQPPALRLAVTADRPHPPQDQLFFWWQTMSMTTALASRSTSSSPS